MKKIKKIAEDYTVKFQGFSKSVRAVSDKHAKFIAWKIYARTLKGKPFKEIIQTQKKFWREASAKKG